MVTHSIRNGGTEYWQNDPTPVSINDAIRYGFSSSAMITVVSALVLEQMLDSNKYQNKFAIIGVTLYLTNVVQYYMQMNGY